VFRDGLVEPVRELLGGSLELGAGPRGEFAFEGARRQRRAEGGERRAGRRGEQRGPGA
jgi:hypothetical protein